MPFYRKRYSRKFAKKPYRKTYRKKPSKRFRTAVKKVINSQAERKYLDYAVSFDPIDTLGTLYNIGRIGTLAQGVDQNSRIGIKIHVTSLLIRLAMFIPAIPVADTSVALRFIIFQWMEPYNSLPTINQILNNQFLGTYSMLSQYSKENAGKFKIMLDKTYTMSVDGTRQINTKWSFSKFKKDLVIANKTPLEPNSGEFYMIVVSDSGASPHPNISFNTRMSFTDT